MINPVVTIRRGAQQLRTTRDATGVPVLRQIQQLAALRFANGTSRTEYFKYRLWRPELTTVERLCYTSQRERRRTERATNRAKVFGHEGGKSVLVDRLTAAGLACAEMLGRIGSHTEATIRTEAELADFLASEGSRPLVIKPERGMQGNDILVSTEGDRTGILLLSGARLLTTDLWRLLSPRLVSGWRVERWVVPHASVADWRRGATPTIRFLTLVVGDAAVVHAATIKVPMGDSGVDNLAKGNLVAEVNLTTGITGPATDGAGQVQHGRHPHSGQPISGLTIPHWDRYLSTVSTGAAALMPYRAIGWDVAVGEHGPVVLEANTKWCEKLVQLPTGRGLTHGAFIRLLHEVGAGGLLARRRQLSSAWRTFEGQAREGAE